MAGSLDDDTSVAGTALLATAALTSNNEAAQAAFMKAGGSQVLSRILSSGQCSPRLQKRAIVLALDLSQQNKQAQVKPAACLFC